MSKTAAHSNAKGRRVEVLRAGTFTPMEGAAVTFTAADLAALAATYDAETAPAPVVVGHPKTDDPAFGWARSFAFDETTGRLSAEIGEIAPEFETAVAEGRYKKISLSLFGPAAPGNPKPGHWYPKHIGFLGAAAPAVPGLKPVQFTAADGAVTFEFADGSAFKDTASLFRRIRDFFIAEFGLERADQVLPDWTISWINDAADRNPPRAVDEPGYFAAPAASPKKETAMADETALADRERDIEARERALQHTENVAFADRMVKELRIIPANKDNLIAALDGLAGLRSQTVSFAATDGTKADTSLLEAVKGLVSANPPVVSLGAMDLGDEPSTAAMNFSLPHGATADPASAALHAKAIAWQATHPGTDYMAAVAAVQ